MFNGYQFSGAVSLFVTIALAFGCSDPVKTELPPVAPSDLKVVEKTAGTITISWTDNSTDESGFLIERNDASDSPRHGGRELDDTTYTDWFLQSEHVYSYRVRAYKQVNQVIHRYSDYTEWVQARTESYDGELPKVPTNLRVTSYDIDCVTLEWDWDENDTTATGFMIERDRAIFHNARRPDSSTTRCRVWWAGHAYSFRMYSYSGADKVRSGYSNSTSVTIPGN